MLVQESFFLVHVVGCLSAGRLVSWLVVVCCLLSVACRVVLAVCCSFGVMLVTVPWYCLGSKC